MEVHMQASAVCRLGVSDWLCHGGTGEEAVLGFQGAEECAIEGSVAHLREAFNQSLTSRLNFSWSLKVP